MLCSHHHPFVPDFLSPQMECLVVFVWISLGLLWGLLNSWICRFISFARVASNIFLAYICLLCFSGSLMTYMSVRPSVIESHFYGTIFIYLLNFSLLFRLDKFCWFLFKSTDFFYLHFALESIQWVFNFGCYF